MMRLIKNISPFFVNAYILFPLRTTRLRITLQEVSSYLRSCVFTFIDLQTFKIYWGPISVILYCLTSGFVNKYITQNKAIRVTCEHTKIVKIREHRNNKAINEFGFRRIWRIKQIWEGVIHLGLRTLWITPSSICLILHILLSLIHQLLIK